MTVRWGQESQPSPAWGLPTGWTLDETRRLASSIGYRTRAALYALQTRGVATPAEDEELWHLEEGYARLQRCLARRPR